MIKPVGKLRRPRILCDGDCECPGGSFLEKVVLALLTGSAPILVTYVIGKLDPSAMEDVSLPEDRSDD